VTPDAKHHADTLSGSGKVVIEHLRIIGFNPLYIATVQGKASKRATPVRVVYSSLQTATCYKDRQSALPSLFIKVVRLPPVSKTNPFPQVTQVSNTPQGGHAT